MRKSLERSTDRESEPRVTVQLMSIDDDDEGDAGGRCAVARILIRSSCTRAHREGGKCACDDDASS